MIVNNIEINTSEEQKETTDNTIKEMEEEKYIVEDDDHHDEDDNDEDNDDDPELDVSEIEIDGKTYYKADNNYLYNSDGDLQGYWNGKKIEIINKQ